MNIYDSELVAGLLEKCGYRETRKINNADLDDIFEAIETANPIKMKSTGISLVCNKHERMPSITPTMGFNA